MFDNFLRGSGQVAMQTFAKAGRAASLAAAPLAMALEKSPNSTELQDKFFKAHDEIFGRAVDYWTPKPTEVGAAGQIVGQLLGTLPMVMASPVLTVAQTQLSTGEDLVRKGVDADKAQAVGAVQAAGLGLGIWVPILGQTLTQRVLMGGAGFNVAQGLATRAASAKLLEGTPGADEFKTFDPTAMTLDVLLGAAFGGIAHINPRMRAEGERWHAKLAEWGKGLKPSEVDALATLRQAQHLNADSLPGKPVDVEDVNAHVARMRQALDDLANDRPVNVEDMPAGRFELDAARQAEEERIVNAMRDEAQAIGAAYDTVLAKPFGPVDDPIVRMTPEQIGDVHIERGPVWKKGEADIDMGNYGLVKIIWKHGEKSAKASGIQVARSDVTRLPEVLRDYLPIRDEMQADGKRKLEWQVQRDDGKKVLYVVSGFADGDRLQHVVSIFVNDGSNPRIAAKTLSEKANRLPESPGGTSRVRPAAAGAGDTNQGSFSVERTGGQEGGSGVNIHQTGMEAQSPIASAAARFAAEHPNMPIVIGRNADGSDITTTPRQWLDDAETDFMRAQEDAKLFEVAAGCLFGGGR
jgi:hypothetical protein